MISLGRILNNFVSPTIPLFILGSLIGNPAILSSVGARLLINMKEAGAKGLNEGMGSSVPRASVSRMYFVASSPQTSETFRAYDDGGMAEEIEMAEVWRYREGVVSLQATALIFAWDVFFYVTGLRYY